MYRAEAQEAQLSHRRTRCASSDLVKYYTTVKNPIWKGW